MKNKLLNYNLLVLKKIKSPIIKEDLILLKEIKDVWKEIEQGKCKTMEEKEFLKELKKW